MNFKNTADFFFLFGIPLPQRSWHAIASEPRAPSSPERRAHRGPHHDCRLRSVRKASRFFSSSTFWLWIFGTAAQQCNWRSFQAHQKHTRSETVCFQCGFLSVNHHFTTIFSLLANTPEVACPWMYFTKKWARGHLKTEGGSSACYLRALHTITSLCRSDF